MAIRQMSRHEAREFHALPAQIAYAARRDGGVGMIEKGDFGKTNPISGAPKMDVNGSYTMIYGSERSQGSLASFWKRTQSQVAAKKRKKRKNIHPRPALKIGLNRTESASIGANRSSKKIHRKPHMPKGPGCWFARPNKGGLQKGLANPWRFKRITKRDHAGRGQQTKLER
jgi:hypothetical protein